MPEPIRAEVVQAAIRALGLEPRDVKELHIDFDQVRVTGFCEMRVCQICHDVHLKQTVHKITRGGHG